MLKKWRDLTRKKPKPPKDQQRLFTIVRADISPGYQLAQSVHGAIETYSDNSYTHSANMSSRWKLDSNTVVCLSVPTLSELEHVHFELIKLGIKPSIFLEPDIGNELTCISFIAHWKTTDKLKHLNLKLALSEFK